MTSVFIKRETGHTDIKGVVSQRRDLVERRENVPLCILERRVRGQPHGPLELRHLAARTVELRFALACLDQGSIVWQTPEKNQFTMMKG